MASKAVGDGYAKSQTAATLASLGQALVPLSGTNTEMLVSSAIHQTRGRRAEATEILNRLQKLNPDVAAQFRPKDDALDSLTLRIIRPADLSPDHTDVLSYIIVSYCWHYHEWPIARSAKPIVPGWEISKPMVDTIMALRQSPNEGVWLDKLCINQGDDGEKRIHIAAMDTIYKSARRLVILLEDIQLTEDETTAGLAYATFYQDLCDVVKERNLEGQEKSDFVDQYFPRREKKYRKEGKGHTIQAIRSFAMKLLSARWFSRAWCAHESRVTPHRKIDNPLFLCFGHNGRVVTFEFRFIFYLAIYLHDREPSTDAEDVSSLDYLDSLSDPTPVTLAQLRFRIQRLMSQQEPDVSAMQHLVNVLSFGCLMKGDLMSIALNTSGIPLYFSGRVSTEEEIIWMFTLLVIAAGDLVPLILSGSKLRITDPNAPGGQMISWAPRVAQAALDNRIPEVIPGTITAITRDFIELDLLVFKNLPSPPTAESLQLAARIMEQHQLDSLARTLAENTTGTVKRNNELLNSVMTRTTTGRGPMAVFHKMVLAHALDCGLDWMLRFPTAMAADTMGETWPHGTMGLDSNPKFTGPAQFLLDHFLPPPTTTNPDENKEHDPSPLLPDMVRVMTTLFDPRLPFLTSSPRRLPLGDNNDYALVPSVSNRSWLAVPVAIAHLPGGYRRAWVVEPFDSSCSAHTPPEKVPEDHLPDLTRVYRPDDREEDVFPLLPSDSVDRRAERNDERGTWRLRRRENIFGSMAWRSVPLDVEAIEAAGEGGPVVLLRKQRVYGAEDYDWAAVAAASKKLRFESSEAS